MTRSHKNCPSDVSFCRCCATFGIKYQREKQLSQRSSKRKTKEYLKDSSQHIYENFPMREKVCKDIKYIPVERRVDLRDSLSYLECYDEERNEGLRNIEEKVKMEMMEVWKLQKSSHVVKKTIKKLEREGKLTIFDDQQVEIPIEYKKRISDWENNSQLMINEAKKYERTGSLKSFQSYRYLMKK